ncbi:MAG TPA: hypothetical protein VK914_05715 [bacterium]|nr:hypothetical protein [bacterium]
MASSTKRSIQGSDGLGFSGKALPLFGWTLWLDLSQYLMVPAPWVGKSYYRWIVDHIEFENGISKNFVGKIQEIWWAFVLIGIIDIRGSIPIKYLDAMGLSFLHSWILLVALIPIVIYLHYSIIRWVVDSIELGPESRLRFLGTYLEYLGRTALLVLSMISIIGWAWVAAGFARWFFENISHDSYNFEFVGTGEQILWRTLATIAACVLIIPIPWMTLWLFKWFLSNVRVSPR